jgi:hypothetical protein
MTLGSRLLIAAITFGVLGFGFAACGGSEKQAGVPSPSGAASLQGTSKDDQSRCDFRGRDDREVSETAGPGAIQPNIRRVYALVGDIEDRRKVLLCREVDTNLDGIKDVVRTYNDRGEALHELADSNYDGKVDTWITFARGRIAKVQIDKNGDARPDETRHYSGGKLSRVERDTNFDGKPDVWEIYEKGRLRRMGVDLDHDGQVDRWDRDEVLERIAEERDREESEREQREHQGQEGAGSSVQDAGTDARVSARHR